MKSRTLRCSVWYWHSGGLLASKLLFVGDSRNDIQAAQVAGGSPERGHDLLAITTEAITTEKPLC
ncbi:MAG: hypothetical protein ACR5K7_04290 [Symbiopectobacterium sp.]